MRDEEYLRPSDIAPHVTMIADLDGDTLEINLAKELSMRDIDNAINTIAMKIAFMERVAASLNCEVDNQKAEMRVYEAKLDEEIRGKKGLLTRGEVRIQRAIERDPGWLKKRYNVNKAVEQWNIARGYCDALKAFANMLEVKSNNMRKFPELREDERFFKTSKFYIKRRVSLVDNATKPLKKKKPKVMEEE